MGIDTNRFDNPSKIDGEFICTICHDVIDSPTRVNAVCEHIFCGQCITDCIEKAGDKELPKLCPNDRNAIREPYYMPPSRYWSNNYSTLQIKCQYRTNGCKAVVNLGDLTKHERVCKHNPCATFHCKQGCGAIVARNAASNHKCIPYLKKIIDQLTQQTLIATSTHSRQTVKYDGAIFTEIFNIKMQLNDLNNRLQTLNKKLEKTHPELYETWPTVQSCVDNKDNTFNNTLIDMEDMKILGETELIADRLKDWTDTTDTTDTPDIPPRRALLSTFTKPNLL